MTIDNTPQGGLEDADAGISETDAEALGSLFLNDDEDDDQSTPPAAQEASQETEEDAEAQADADDSDEDDAEEADDADEDNEEGQPVELNDDMKIVLSDGTETTLKDLKQSHFRHEHFTKRTQEAVEEKKQYSEAAQRVQQLEQTLAAERQQMGQMLQSMMPQEPDPSMMDDDPIGYMKARENYDRQVNAMRQIAAQSQQSQMAMTQEQQAQEQAFLEEQRRLMIEANPDFADPAEFQSFSTRVKSEFAPAYGFTAEELSTVRDHRFVKVMRDAMAYQALQQKAPAAKKSVEGKPPVLKSAPRKGKASKAGREVDQRLAKARQSGDVTNVSDILGELLA